MIYSMTGYAARTLDVERGALHIELKSVNSRYLDFQFRVCEELRSAEPALRELFSARLPRGKLECRLSFAPATARAEYDIYKDIPAPARIDRTWDNGTESSCHLLVDEALGMLTYYANPYSSHQRGSNENRNGRIRRYLPKKTSFDDLTDADLQAIVDEINDTPMKVLDWETPNEVWYRELGKLMPKTSHPKTSVALTN